MQAALSLAKILANGRAACIQKLCKRLAATSEWHYLTFDKVLHQHCAGLVEHGPECGKHSTDFLYIIYVLHIY